ncbi:MAG: TetR/AcrR family transcriptional regulator [Nautiliaceae bacterium]
MSTKEQILKKALEIFAKKGYENTNLEEIAKEVGITKPAIYYHFKSKKELYNYIFKEKFKKLNFTSQQTLEENLKHYIYTLGEFFIKNPNIAKLFSKEISNEALHLNDDTLKEITKTIKFLSSSLKETNLNPLFIQTLIISSFTTYTNTLNLRSRIKEITKEEFKEFNITDEVYETIITYIKAKI